MITKNWIVYRETEDGSPVFQTEGKAETPTLSEAKRFPKNMARAIAAVEGKIACPEEDFR